MIKFLPYVLRSVLRNRVRTVLTVLGIAVAVALIAGLGSLKESRARALDAASQTILLVSEKDVYWPTKSLIPGDRGLARRIAAEVPGVVRATPLVIKQNLWMSTGGGLVKIAGVDKQALREFWEIEVEPAVWEEFLSRRNGALLGVDLARDRDLRNRYVWEKGKEFVLADLGDLSLYFTGTFTPRDPTLRSVILTGDVFLQEADERRGVANQILVRLGHRDEAEAAASAIAMLDNQPRLHAATQQEARDQAGSGLQRMIDLAGHVIAVVAVVILIGLANATSMAVRERVREVGILRALGFSRRRIVALIAGESLLLSLAGGAGGCAVAFAVLRLAGLSVSVGNFAFPVTLTALLAAVAITGSAAVGILGGLPAGIRASRRPIVEALRSVE